MCLPAEFDTGERSAHGCGCRRLAGKVEELRLLIEIHYRHYQFYANMLVALVWSYAISGCSSGWRGVAYWIVALVFLFASRDALRKYYERTGQLLRARSQKSE